MCTTCMIEYQAANTSDGSSGEISAATGTVSDYTALLRYYDSNNARWNGNTDVGTQVIVTYSFTESADLPALSTYNPYNASSYWSYNSAQRLAFQQALNEFESVAGIKFVEVEGDAMVEVFGANVSGVGGWANYAYSSDFMTGSGYFVNAYSSQDPGAYGFQINLHEMGHALGLKHPHEGGSLTLASTLDTQANTVMTYNVRHPYAQDLGTMDAQALAHIYGGANSFDGWSVSAVDNGTHVKIIATGGNDKIISTDILTTIKAGAGADEIIGRESTDRAFGQRGNDVITGGYGNDTLSGGDNNDLLIGGLDQSDISGSASEADFMYGGTGMDTLYGGNGEDRLLGGDDNDRLYGGNGNDIVSGGRGNDTIKGGAGADKLSGKAGIDHFVFDNLDANATDRIYDFTLNVDKIDLSGIAGLSFGNLSIKDNLSGADALVEYGGWLSIRLHNVDHTMLDANDFIF